MLSPSSRSIDLVLKRELYEQAGVASYWVVDPDGRLTAWDLTDGRYGEPLEVTGVVTVSRPYEVTLDLDELARG